MRDIKFRAWHEYGNQKSNPVKPGMIYDNNPGDCLRWLQEGQHIIDIMQYTGIDDYNGKKIYEGDIVKGVASPQDSIEKISFVGEVQWDSEDAGFYYYADGSWPHIKPWFCERVEVIGNKYEKHECHCEPDQGGPCSSCMERKYNL